MSSEEWLAAAERRAAERAASAARVLAAARTDQRIREIVDRAPPLSPEVRDRLALLLRGSEG